jgi:hypothetical protein
MNLWFYFPNKRVKVVYIFLVLIFIGFGAYNMENHEDGTFLTIGICMIVFNGIVIPALNFIIKLFDKAN